MEFYTWYNMSGPWNLMLNQINQTKSTNIIWLHLDEVPAAAAKSLQSCPTLCDPVDGSPPGSAVPGILQARTLEWVAISFSNTGKWKVKVNSLSRVQLLATPWTSAHQAPLSMEFFRQEYWSGVPLPSTDNKCWRRYGEKGTLWYGWWECKLVQSLCRAEWRLLKKLKIWLPYDPATPLHIYR